MISFDEASAKLLAAVDITKNKEPVNILEACNRVLAVDIFAPCYVPPHDNSAMDGFALRAEDVASTSTLPISQKVFAGMAPESLQQGTAVRLFTGSVIPDGADTVVPQENCDYDDEKVTINELSEPGLHIRRRGEDITEGQKIITQGTLLKPGHIGLLASLGIATVEAYKVLKVGLLSTGDELVDPGTALQAGQIYNSNSPMLKAELEKLGFIVEVRHAEDTLELITEAFRQLGENNDLVLSIGGVSVGEADFVKAAVESLGSLDLWKVAIKPGKPLSFGHIAGTPAMGLPGNPVASFATFHLFAKPYLYKMQGLQEEERALQSIAIQLERPLSPKREEFVRVQLQVVNGEQKLVLYSHQGSGVLSSVAWASGFARIPMNITTSDGDKVPYLPFT